MPDRYDYDDRYTRDPYGREGRREPYRSDPYRNEPYRGERGYRRDDRGFFDRAGDEVRSWFGDEEAERRRRVDERERERGYSSEGRPERGWAGTAGAERGWSGERWSTDEGRVEFDRPRRGFTESSTSRDYRPEWRSSSRSWESDYDRERNRETAWMPRPVNYYDSPPGSSPGSLARSREGGFSGRGPKGYQRSDTRITEDVCDRLADAPDIDASEIEVKVTGGDVTLTGAVRDRWEKRRAEDLIENVSGVRDVHNHLRTAAFQRMTTGAQEAAGGQKR